MARLASTISLVCRVLRHLRLRRIRCDYWQSSYVELLKVKSYRVRNFETVSCGNLYALAVERSLRLISPTGSVGLIVPLSLVCTARTAAVRSLVRTRQSWVASFDMRPNSLFEGVSQRLCIFVNRPRRKSMAHLFTAGYRRWAGAARSALLTSLEYQATIDTKADAVIAKYESAHEISIRAKISGQPVESFARKRATSGEIFPDAPA